MSCKDCRGSFRFSGRVDQVRRLYSPTTSLINRQNSERCKKRSMGPCCGQGQKRRLRCGLRDNLKFQCYPKPDLCRRWKSYWKDDCDIKLLRLYEDQPWFNDPIVQNEWGGFCKEVVTPANICYKLQPSADSYRYDCQKMRGLMGPQVMCTWDYPEPDECSPVQYGVNRDWRQYNEDQRMRMGEVECGCFGDPICKPPKRANECPPYLGKKFGARYMAWPHRISGMYPRTKPFHSDSYPVSC